MWSRKEEEPTPTPEERDATQDAAIIQFRQRSKKIDEERRAASQPLPKPGQSDADFAAEQSYWQRIRAYNAERRGADKRAGTSAYALYPRRQASAYSLQRSEAKRELAYYAGALVLIMGGSVLSSVISDANYGGKKAAQFVEDQGYSHVRVTDKHLLFPGLNGCDASDRVAYDVQALSAQEAAVVSPTDTSITFNERNLVVCVGLFKGATLRDDS